MITELPTKQPAPLTRLRNRAALIVQREQTTGQGRHVDPEHRPESKATARWSACKWRAMRSPAMTLFAAALRSPAGGTVRDGVIDDLAEYYGISPTEVVERCLSWEADSVAEWTAASGIDEFYNSTTSWAFDLLWYAYLQTDGIGYPESVIVADAVAPHAAGRRVLDLGSGVGVTAQLWAALGYQVTLADVSETLLAFARWRLERRGVSADYVHLPAGGLPDGLDLVTALDVIAHVPDIDATARQLRAAMNDGGLLVCNYDVRRASAANAWHLYEDDLPLRWAVQRAGFTPTRLVDGRLWIYRTCRTSGAGWVVRRAAAWCRLASPPARLIRAARRQLARAALAIAIRAYARFRPATPAPRS